MAYVKSISPSIKTQNHLSNALNYKGNTNKSFNPASSDAVQSTMNYMSLDYKTENQFYTCINCTEEETSLQFRATRIMHNKDSGILAHHYVQSFSPEEKITPEQAHKIGIELINKIAPNYQCTISTHLDKKHIHNHIIINSVNLKTGYKWHGNKATLNIIRNISDELCKKNNLSIIEPKNEFKSIDQSTWHLAVKGKSWKVNLTTDLDEAMRKVKDKEAFIKFLKDKDYSVRYTDNHITVRKNGEQKGIRLDTLAKTFGQKYSKTNIEKLFISEEAKKIFDDEILYKDKDKKTITKLDRRTEDNYKWKSEFQRFEAWTFENKKKFQTNSQKEKFSYHLRMIESVKRSIGFSRANSKLAAKLFFLFLLTSSKEKREEYKAFKGFYNKNKSFKVKNKLKGKDPEYRIIGNINYYKLLKAQGNNLTLKIPATMITKVYNQPFFYSGKINNDGTAIITIKENNKDLLLKALGVTDYSLNIKDRKEDKERSKPIDTHGTFDIYNQLKLEAKDNNSKLLFKMINEEQLNRVMQGDIKFAYFKKEGGKFNIAYHEKDLKAIDFLIYGERRSKPIDTHGTFDIYNQLKLEAKDNNSKLLFKMINEEQLNRVMQGDIKFAYFKKEGGKFNIAYHEKDLNAIDNLVYAKKESDAKSL